MKQQLRHRLDSLLEGIQIISHDWRYVYLNDIMLQQTNAVREDLIGFTMMEKFPNIEHTEIFKVLRHCMISRQSVRVENKFTFPDGSQKWFDLAIEPADEGICILSLDITPYKEMLQSVKKSKGLYDFLSQINQAIVHSKSDRMLFQKACRVAVKHGKFSRAWIGLFDRKKKKITVATQSGFSAKEGLPSSLSYTKGDTYDQLHQTGKYVLENNVERFPFAGQAGNAQTFLSLPIRSGGKTLGTFNLYAEEPGFVGPDETRLLLEVSHDISFALDHYVKVRHQRETEQLIEKNEKRFRALIEKGADMKTLAARNGKLLYGSPSITRVLGYLPTDTAHLNIYDLIHPDDQSGYMSQRAALGATSGASAQFELRLLHKDGHYLWCEGSATNLLDEPGVNAIVSNFRDISEKKTAEQQLEFDRNNMNALINNTKDLLWSVDTDLKLITANRPLNEFMKRVSNRSIQPGDDILPSNQPEEKLKIYRELYDRALKGEAFSAIVPVGVSPEIWWEISFYPISKDNRIIGIACHARDITARRLLERNLQDTIREISDLKYALDESSIVAITDHKGVITHVNDNFCAISKYTCDELIGQDHRIINSGYHPKRFIKKLWATIASGHIWRGEIRNRDKNGGMYWVDTTIVPFLGDQGRPYQYIAIRSDITQRKEAEEKLLRNNEELRKTNSELDRFVYSISHDLRAPLTSIRGLLGIIEEETGEPMTREHAKLINGRIDRLDIFIKNLLNYSRTNRTSTESTPIKVEPIAREVVESLQNMKQAQGLSFEFEFDELRPFHSDKQSISTLLENLVSNAIKFHLRYQEYRFVRISAKTAADGLSLVIADNGLGIPSEAHEKVFDMFYRLPGKTEGSGIGLYIVKQLIEKLQGTIVLDSRPGEGSTFKIQLKNLTNEHELSAL